MSGRPLRGLSPIGGSTLRRPRPLQLPAAPLSCGGAVIAETGEESARGGMKKMFGGRMDGASGAYHR